MFLGVATQLEYLAEERRRNAISGIQLSRCTKVNGCLENDEIDLNHFSQVSDWPNAYRVVQSRSVKQLVFVEGNHNEHDTESTNVLNEVVAHVQGIIWRHDLPPFRNQGMYVCYLAFHKNAYNPVIGWAKDLQTD